VDEHLDKAFASLQDIPARELHATAKALERRKDRLGDFSSIFRNVADARRGGWSPSVARFHLGQAVSRADEGFVEQISEVEAPFWRHVRDALASSQGTIRKRPARPAPLAEGRRRATGGVLRNNPLADDLRCRAFLRVVPGGQHCLDGVSADYSGHVQLALLLLRERRNAAAPKKQDQLGVLEGSLTWIRMSRATPSQLTGPRLSYAGESKLETRRALCALSGFPTDRGSSNGRYRCLGVKTWRHCGQACAGSGRSPPCTSPYGCRRFRPRHRHR
jgi:hypothetical protein